MSADDDAPPTAAETGEAPPVPQDPLAGPVCVELRLAQAVFRTAGGLGEIHTGRDGFGREVALKTPKSPSISAEFRLRLEASNTARLEHPGVVPVFGMGVDAEGRPVFAMRFVQGDELAPPTDAEEFIPRESLSHLLAVCNCVRYAHSEGVIHCDLKPANIRVGDFGEVLVLDWGLSWDTKADAISTPRPAGSAGYAAPDLSRQSPIDERSDVYSLGGILHYLLTGRHPPRSGLDDGALERLQADARNRHPGLVAICRKAMRPDPAKRYAKVEILAADVKKVLDDEKLDVPGVGDAKGYSDPLSIWGPRMLRRNPGVVGSVVTGALTAVILVAAFWQFTQEERRGREFREQEERRQRDLDDQRRDFDKKLLEERLRRERETSEAQKYAGQIREAFTARVRGDGDAAKSLLAATDPTRRGWEYHFVRRDTSDVVRVISATQPVTAVAAHGNRLAWAAGGQVHLDNAAKKLDAEGPVAALAFSRDGTQLAAAVAPEIGAGYAQVWFLSETVARPHRRFDMRQGPATALAFGPGARLLAGGGTPGEPGELTEHDTRTGRTLARLRTPKNRTPIQAVTVADAATQAWSDEEQTVVRISDRQVTYRRCGPFGLFPDGSRLLLPLWEGTRGTLAEIDLRTGKERPVTPARRDNAGELLIDHTGRISAVAVRPDGRFVATAGSDNVILLRDLASGVILRTYREHHAAVTGMTFTSDGNHLVSSSADHRVVVRRPSFEPDRLTQPTAVSCFDLAIRPDGSQVAVVGISPFKLPSVAILDAFTGRLVRRFGTAETAACAFHPFAAELATAGKDGAINLWNPDTGKRTASLGVSGLPHASRIAYDADGRFVAAAVHGTDALDGIGSLRIFDARTRRCLALLPVPPEGISSFAFHPSVPRVAVAGRKGTVEIRDVPSGSLVRTFATRVGRPLSIAFRPGAADRIALGGTDIRPEPGRQEINLPWTATLLIDPQDGGEVAAIVSASNSAVFGESVAFSPDGRRLVAADGVKGRLRVFDVATGGQLLELPAATNTNGVAFTANGHRIVTATMFTGRVEWFDGRPLPP